MPNYINIVPLYPGHEDFTISEIRRQRRDVGIDKIALSCSWHPQTTPSSALIPVLTRSMEIIISAVKDEVEVGVLIQSTQGHGWSGKTPLTDDPFQRIYRMGSSTPDERMCIADESFRNYIYDCIKATAALGPKFLLIDDDFGPRVSECFCPLHTEAFNKALGTNYTGVELAWFIDGLPWDAPEAKLFSEMRLNDALEFAKGIRRAIDSVNPELPCGLCIPGWGQGFVNDAAHALAGDKTAPFVRICNAVYGGVHQKEFVSIYNRTLQLKALLDFPDLIGEVDTFPQNYNSESARFFVVHLILDALAGLKGGKLWISDFNGPIETSSQARYEAALKKYYGMCAEIVDLVSDIEWQGAAGLLMHYPQMMLMHPLTVRNFANNSSWTKGVFPDYAIPFSIAKAGESKITALTADELSICSEEEILKLFSGNLLLDGTAAIYLSEKYSHLMGVTADNGDESFSFTLERDVKSGVVQGMMWDENFIHLTLKGATEQVQFCQGNTRVSDEVKYISPAMTFFENELGGRVAVVGWNTRLPFFKLWRPQQRKWILDALDFLAGDTFEMVVESEHQTLVQHGRLKDGRELLAILSLGFDTLDAIPVRMKRTPKAIEKLLPNGTWTAVDFKRTDSTTIRINDTLEICIPVVYRMQYDMI